MASTTDLVDWRMRALGLWQSIPGGDVTAVVDRLLALQGQDWGASRWALGVRAPGIRDSDVIDAFDSGELVRSWPMRSTIHILAARDLRWMQAATNHRVLRDAPKRRAYLGLDDDSLATMTDVAIESLTGGRSMSRDELAEAWTRAGIAGPSEKGLGPWRYHVVWWLCQNGITVPGPTGEDAGTEPRLVLAEEWIADSRDLEGEEALAELAARFAAGRGPILDRDLAWWTGLTLRESRLGIDAAANDERLTAIEVDGRRYWAEPALLDAADAPPAHPAALLLPGFDEHLLGYTDRSAVLDGEQFERIVPGRNGVFRPTVVAGPGSDGSAGRVIGTWARRPSGSGARLEIDPFPGRRIDLDDLRAAAHSWSAFTGRDAALVHR